MPFSDWHCPWFAASDWGNMVLLSHKYYITIYVRIYGNCMVKCSWVFALDPLYYSRHHWDPTFVLIVHKVSLPQGLSVYISGRLDRTVWAQHGGMFSELSLVVRWQGSNSMDDLAEKGRQTSTKLGSLSIVYVQLGPGKVSECVI